jgi:hypothetical protein
MKRTVCTLVVLSSVVLGAGCNKSAEKTPEVSANQQAASHTEHAAAPAPTAPTKVEAPANAKVFFVAPSDGAEIKGALEDGGVKVSVQMGAENIQVKPAGELVQGTGHHHIIVDGEGVASPSIVPKDETHIHFGKGQTEAELFLAPGEHKLTLQFADGMHQSYGPQLSSTIKVKVAAQ